MEDLNLSAAPDSAAIIMDVSEATFMQDVVEASRDMVVIVDFWAPWCGPCKQLTPTLEEAVRAKGGKVRLAKVNVDENQQIAAQMRVQSIPAVFAFVNGQPVDAFMGAQTLPQINVFIDRAIDALGPDEGLEQAVAAANEMLEEGAIADAAQTFGAILTEEPENADAMAGMARCYLAMGDTDKARAILDTAPDKLRDHPALAAVRAEMDLAEASADAGEVGELRAALEADPNNHTARFDLALALAGAGDNENAIEELLELFRRDRNWNEGAAKEQLLKLFDLLGPKDEVAQSGRRRLSSMIFA